MTDDDLVIENARLRQENDALRAENARLRPLIASLQHDLARLRRERSHDDFHTTSAQRDHA